MEASVLISSEKGEGRLYLVRHGECGGSGYLGRRCNPGLTALGENQADALAAWLFHQESVAPRFCSSPLLRASRTADVLAERWGASVEVYPGLEEMDFGLWEGLSYEDISQKWPDESRRWIADPLHHAPPEGLSGEAFWTQVEELREKLFEALTAGKSVVAVSHGGVIRLMLCILLGLDFSRQWHFRVDRGSVTEILVTQGYPVIERMNYFPDSMIH